MKVAWVLAGGGAAGAVQVGVIKALSEAGHVPDMLFGTSAGAMNAFGYSNVGADGLHGLWKQIKSESDVFTGNYWAMLPWRSGFKKATPLQELLQQNLNRDPDQVPFEVCTLNLITGEPNYFPHYDSEIVKMTIASASIPGYIEPVERSNIFYADGGAIENVPLKRAVEWGADRIIVMLCHPLVNQLTDSWRPGNPVSVLMRMYKCRQQENMRNDMRLFYECNKEAHRDDSECKYIDLHVVAPDTDVLDVLDFNEKAIARGIAVGEMLGQRLLSTLGPPTLPDII